MSDIPGSSPDGGQDLPPDLRFLKVLVTALAGTMILGLITIIALFVIRLPGAGGTAPTLPAHLDLPAGTKAEAVTFGTGWIAVVTETNEILILDAATGKLRQRLILTE